MADKKLKTMKNIKITYNTINLLNTPSFLSALKFEADYANTVKGGHLPQYINEQKRKRLASNVNLLDSSESLDLITNLFIGKN